MLTKEEASKQHKREHARLYAKEYNAECRLWQRNNIEQFCKYQYEYYHKNKEELLAKKREMQRLQARIRYWKQRVEKYPTDENKERLQDEEMEYGRFLERRNGILVEAS